MKVTGPTKRIPWKYTEKKRIPSGYERYLWDYSGKTAPLEVILCRLLTYGDFDTIKWVAREYPGEIRELMERYREAPFCSEGRMRGIHFWIKEWDK